MEWIAGAVQPNPQADDILVATEEFTHGGPRLVQILVAAKMGFDAVLQHRSRGNTANERIQIIPVVLGLLITPKIGPIYCRVGERFRLVARAAVGGEVQASIIVEIP